MDTTDLTSYYPGYDEYCDRLEEEAKVPYSDYEKLEEKNNKYENFVEEIKSAMEAKTTLLEKFKLLQAIVEDFEV